MEDIVTYTPVSHGYAKVDQICKHIKRNVTVLNLRVVGPNGMAYSSLPPLKGGGEVWSGGDTGKQL